MGSWGSLRCDNCGHVVKYSGPWEFCRDEEGNVLEHGHPAPNENGRKYGCHGLRSTHYCVKCDKHHVMIDMEFETPVRGFGVVFQSALDDSIPKKKTSKKECPCCGTKVVVKEKCPDCGEELTKEFKKCFKCGKGEYKQKGGCIS